MFINLSKTVYDGVDSSDLASIKPWPTGRGLLYQDAVATNEFYSYDRAALVWEKVLTVEGKASAVIQTQRLNLLSGGSTQVQGASAYFWVRMRGYFISHMAANYQFGASFSAMQLALKIGEYSGFLETTGSGSDYRFFTASLGIGRYPIEFYGRYGRDSSRPAAYQLRYRTDNIDWQNVVLTDFVPN